MSKKVGKTTKVDDGSRSTSETRITLTITAGDTQITEVLDNLNATGIGAPGLLTDYIYHPISAIRAHDNLAMAGASAEDIIKGIKSAQEQEGKVIWRHKSFYREHDNSKRIYSNVQVTDPDAIKVIDDGIVPKFVSSSAYLYDQPTGKGISKKLHYLHTAIVKKPALSIRSCYNQSIVYR